MENDNKLWIVLLGIAGAGVIAYYIYTTRAQESIVLYASEPTAYIGDSIELYGTFVRSGKPSAGEIVYIYQTDKYSNITMGDAIIGPLATDGNGTYSTTISMSEPGELYFVTYAVDQIPS